VCNVSRSYSNLNEENWHSSAHRTQNRNGRTWPDIGWSSRFIWRWNARISDLVCTQDIAGATVVLGEQRADWKDDLWVREVPKKGFVRKDYRLGKDQNISWVAKKFGGSQALGCSDRCSSVAVAVKRAAGDELERLCYADLSFSKSNATPIKY
jgi:hypothetical protein